MIIGQTIHESTTPYYSPWFPRQGDAATFAIQVIARSGADLDVVVEHKNTEDPDSAATGVATFATISTVKVETQRGTGLKELVRFRYTVSGTAPYDWVHFRVPPPSWEHNGA